MSTVREAIVRAFQYVRITFNERDVATVEAKVTAHKPVPTEPVNFAHVVARNWAISRRRKSASDAKRILREERDAAEARRLAEQKRLAYDTYSSLCLELAAHVSATQLRHLEVVRLVCFEGKKDADVAARFPDSNADLRYQWKKRGLDLIWSHASPVLRDFLATCTRRGR